MGEEEQGRMSKIATYLQEHISGEVTTNPAVLEAMSVDAGVLKLTPEMVVYPRATNDIRKIARFAWQLAEKGHVLPLTPRGHGTDQTGGAIGKGIILSLPAHMYRILEFDAKQKLVRVQPGADMRTVNSALLLQGMAIPAGQEVGTIGGAVAKNMGSLTAGKYGTAGDWIGQLEVVLTNGDLLQTERLSKRELGKRKGLQTFEGEIYRAIDGLIEDNKQLIEDKIAFDVPDNVGYSSIAKVKQKDGSFDLTPLLAGSQGTLGVISEMIMKTDFIATRKAVAAVTFTNKEVARDALDKLRALQPAFLEYYDATVFALAALRGRTYELTKEVGDKLSAVVLVGFDDFSDRNRTRKLKKLEKILRDIDCGVMGADGDEAESLLAIREVTAFAAVPEGKGLSAPPLFDGAYVPVERFEEYQAALVALASKYQVVLPLHGQILTGLMYARPLLHLHKVGDKQKVLKLAEEYATLVARLGGHLIGEGGEGRIKARFAHKELDPEVVKLFEAIKNVFDPHGILNPGVKQVAEVRQLAQQLRADYDTAALSVAVPYN